MGLKYTSLTDPTMQAVLDRSLRENPALAKLREEMASHPNGGYQIAPDQGQILALFAKLLGAKSYLEVGVFTGYSSGVVAEAMPEDGRITACDVSEEFTARAKQLWEEMGVGHKVELKIAPAEETLASLIRAGRQYDMAFLDADKPSYPTYYEQCLKLVRPGGLILIDNVLWGGRFGDPSQADEVTRMFEDLTLKIRDDERVDMAFLTQADGILVCRVR